MKRDQLDPSTNVGGVIDAMRDGRSGDSYWRCLDCDEWFLAEVEAECHLNAPMSETPHAARTGVAEFRLKAPHIGKATGMNVWPSDAGGANYDNRSELKQQGLTEGVDFRLPPPKPPEAREPVVGVQSGPLVDADPWDLIRSLRSQADDLRAMVVDLTQQRDREHATLQAALREREDLDKLHAESLEKWGTRAEEQEREIEALRETVVAQSQEVKRLRQVRAADDSGMVDVDELPDHLRTAVHKLREFTDYKPLMLKPSPPEAIHGEVTGWIIADVIGGGHPGEFAIWAYTGDVYRSPRGEVDDDTGVIIPGTRKVEA